MRTNEVSEQSDEQLKSSVQEKPRYHRPELVKLGSIRELTLGSVLAGGDALTASV